MTKFSFLKKISLAIFLLANTANLYAQDVESLKSKVLEVMGGQKNYEKTRYIHWTFFGNQSLTWDKHKSRVRIDFLKENSVYILNINDKTGKILKKGVEQTHPDSLNKFLEEAKRIWINHSYWLVMPWKLGDHGVSLKYMGDSKTADGNEAEYLEMTFKEVGVTPNNKYWIYFDKKSHLITQWSHFSNFADEKPRFTMPWKDYKMYGKILLSGDRGERKLTDIAVYQKLDESVFTDFKKPELIK
jgi:hypothetical protein